MGEVQSSKFKVQGKFKAQRLNIQNNDVRHGVPKRIPAQGLEL
jgi:hypothetical protein